MNAPVLSAVVTGSLVTALTIRIESQRTTVTRNCLLRNKELQCHVNIRSAS